MSNNWTLDFEQQVHSLFAAALVAENDIMVWGYIERLERLGLSEKQIQNGLTAGIIQLAMDLGISGVSEPVLSMMKPEDARIVMESIQAIVNSSES